MECKTNSVMSKRENISYMNCSVAFPTQVSFIGSAIPTGSLYSADITSASGSSRYRHRRRLHIAANHDRLLLLLRRRHLNKIARHKRTVSRNLCVFSFLFFVMLIQQLTTRVLIISFGFNNITERRERCIELRTNLQNRNRKNTDHKRRGRRRIRKGRRRKAKTET